jgi:hypothetical protein
MNHRRVTTSHSSFHLVYCFPTEHCSCVRDVIVYAINIRRDKGILFATPYKVKMAGLGRTGVMCRGPSQKAHADALACQVSLQLRPVHHNGISRGMCCVGYRPSISLPPGQMSVPEPLVVTTNPDQGTLLIWNQRIHNCLYKSSTVNAGSE